MTIRSISPRVVAGVLGRPPADFVWMMEPGGKIVHFGLDTVERAAGFRTQVTLSFDPKESPHPKNDLELALMLSPFGNDALVLEDPTRPGEETFHGLLARPNGQVFLVPLKELKDGVDVDATPERWKEWRAT